jgi:hypothetical protein
MKYLYFSIAPIVFLSGCAAAEFGNSPPKVMPVAKGEKEFFTGLDGLLQAQAKDMTRRMGWENEAAEPLKDYDVVVYRGGQVLVHFFKVCVAIL